jgi:hypothetical protein
METIVAIRRTLRALRHCECRKAWVGVVVEMVDGSEVWCGFNFREVDVGVLALTSATHWIKPH